MPILSVDSSQPTGLASVNPSVIYILTNDTYATVTATGYLTLSAQQGNTYRNDQMALVYTSDDGPVWLKVVITYSGSTVLNSVVSLVAPSIPGTVTLPTIANHFIGSTDTEGTLANITGTMIQDGSIQAGRSGIAGALISYSSTAARGSFIFQATANTGNTNTTLTNAAMGQASTVTIPDPVNAAGRLLIGATATPFVSGNFPVASGTGGLMVDSGVAAAQLMRLNAVNTMTGSGQIILVKVNGTEAANAVTASGNAGVITTSSLTTAAGGTYSITWTNTLITATSVIGLTIQGGTNTVFDVVFSVVPGSGTATLVIHNVGPTDPLNGTILIGYTVL